MDIEVELAGGVVKQMKLTERGTVIAPSGTQPIVPMSLLVKKLDCEIAWARGYPMKLIHPVKGVIQVDDLKGTPTINREVALELIRELEEVISQRPDKQDQGVRALVVKMCERIQGESASPRDQTRTIDVQDALIQSTASA